MLVFYVVLFCDCLLTFAVTIVCWVVRLALFWVYFVDGMLLICVCDLGVVLFFFGL